MERPKPLDDADSVPDSTVRATAFVVLPDEDADTQVEAERPTQPARGLIRWSSSIAMLGRPSPISALMRLASSGDETDPRYSMQARDDRSSIHRTDPTRSRPAILRAVSSILARPSFVEKFRCYICYDDVPVAEAVTLISCGHRYCESCFESYLSVKINEGHVHPVCFHPFEEWETRKTCGTAVAEEQIEAIVDAEVWNKFTRFRFNQEHEHARECPHCAFTQECEGPSDPSCVCSQCNKPFCFFHGNAHEYGSCADYELKNAETEALTRAMIDKLAKPCPGCTRDIEKDGGCNHIKCVACKTSFCWLCGALIDDVPIPSHFDRTKDGSCSGKQFDRTAAEAAEPSRTGRVLLALGYVAMLPIAVLLTPFVWYHARERSVWDTYKRVHHAVADGFAFFIVAVLALSLGIIVGVLGVALELMIRYWALTLAIATYICVKAICEWIS